MTIGILALAGAALPLGLAVPVNAGRWASIRARGRSRLVVLFVAIFGVSSLVLVLLPLGLGPLFPEDPTAQRRLELGWLPQAALLVAGAALFGWLLARLFWARNEWRFRAHQMQSADDDQAP